MESLPDHVLLTVFQSLNKECLCLGARMTCTRWRRLSFDSSLWRYVAVPDHFTDVRLSLLLRDVHEDVEQLEMSNCNCLTSAGFSQLAKDLYFPRLKKISVPICTTLPDVVYEALSSACPVLEETENIRATYSRECHPIRCQMLFKTIRVLHDRPVSTYGRIRKDVADPDLAKRRRWLVDLNLAASKCPDVLRYCCERGMEFMNVEAMQALGQLFPRLNGIELRNCTMVDECFEAFFSAMRNGGGLLELILDKPGSLSDRSLKLIADCCPDLEKLKVSRCGEMTNVGVQYLVGKCTKLTDLHINNAVGCFEDADSKICKDDISDDTLFRIGDNLSRLNFLRIFYSQTLTSVGLASVVAGCRYLHGIMLFECSRLDDEALQSLTKLRFLKAAIVVDCDLVTSRGVIDFILRVRNLARLTFYTRNTDFYGDMLPLCEDVYGQIDDVSCALIPNAITRLALRGVGSGFLQLLTVLCPNLRSLDLRGSCFVNTGSLVSVLKNCEVLHDLDIASVEKSDDDFLRACCRYGNRLRTLSLGSTVRYLSSDAIHDVIRTCASLNTLCMDVREADIDEEEIIRTAKQYHGGHCFLYVDLDDTLSDEDPKQRYIEFHFTPIKYLNSINTITV